MKSIKELIIECLPMFVIGILSIVLPLQSVIFINQIIIGLFLILLGFNYLIFSNVSMDKKNLLYYITILLFVSGLLILFNGITILTFILILILLILTMINIFVFHDKSISLINLLIVNIIIFVYSLLQNYLDVLKIVVGCLSILAGFLKFISLFRKNKPNKENQVIDCEYNINE